MFNAMTSSSSQSPPDDIQNNKDLATCFAVGPNIQTKNRLPHLLLWRFPLGKESTFYHLLSYLRQRNTHIEIHHNRKDVETNDETFSPLKSDFIWIDSFSLRMAFWDSSSMCSIPIVTPHIVIYVMYSGAKQIPLSAIAKLLSKNRNYDTIQ